MIIHSNRFVCFLNFLAFRTSWYLLRTLNFISVLGILDNNFWINRKWKNKLIQWHECWPVPPWDSTKFLFYFKNVSFSMIYRYISQNSMIFHYFSSWKNEHWNSMIFHDFQGAWEPWITLSTQEFADYNYLKCWF